MSEDKKVFRSLIKKHFPDDLLVKLHLLADAHDVDNNAKGDELKQYLTEYNVPFTSLGSGTNRFGILIDGYAVKIALDRMGKIDNMREFKYVKQLGSSVVKVYECCPNGLIAVFEYVTIFSLDDFYSNQSEMRKILKEITSQFLAGDIGISNHNYVNWGTRLNGDIVILDFAYIYSLSFRGFQCTCEDEGTLEYEDNYNYLRCPFCGKKYSFADIRKRITRKDELDEIGDIRKLGYVLHSSEEELPIDPEKTLIKENKKKKDKQHHIKPKEKEISQEQALKEINNMIYHRNVK